MRVISLVPSITETLIECGVEVVGRTRFCIHPAAQVEQIVKVGGTKGVDWERCKALNPDIVVFDREENLKQMAEECPFPWTATHINSLHTAGAEFKKLGAALESSKLQQHAADWSSVADRPNLASPDWNQVPGQIDALHNRRADYARVEYIIWRSPWMAVSAQTFIGSVLQKLGFAPCMSEHTERYPTLSSDDMARDDTFYLFSSEPYRFHRYREQLEAEGFNGAIVDGELYSWFGIRSLRGLQFYLR
jgi:hypothetical protein